MMRNDLPYAPSVNGRWYKIFLENDAGTIKITHTDIICYVYSSEKQFGLYVNEDFTIIDFMIKSVVNSTGSCNINRRYLNGRDGILFSNVDVIDNLTIYVYCERV